MVKSDKVIGVLRIALGFIFLWAFFDKMFGLGFSTAKDKAVILGNSPTFAFLSNAVYGPFSEIYKSLAGNIIIDVLFMSALLIIGITLVFGVGVKYGSAVGAFLVFLMWTAELPPKNNPLIDEHIIYVIIFVYFIITKSDELSFVNWLKNAWKK